MLKRNKLVKWGLYSAVTEELLSYVDDDETITHFADIPTRGTSHKSIAVTRAFGKEIPRL